jgi:hypothetical protein
LQWQQTHCLRRPSSTGCTRTRAVQKTARRSHASVFTRLRDRRGGARGQPLFQGDPPQPFPSMIPRAAAGRERGAACAPTGGPSCPNRDDGYAGAAMSTVRCRLLRGIL